MLAIGRGLMARPSLLRWMSLRRLRRRWWCGKSYCPGGLEANGMTIVLVEQNTVAALKVTDRALVMEREGLS